MSKISKREAYRILVKTCIEQINYHSDESIRKHACNSDEPPGSKWTIDGQCLERFGKNWNEIKYQVFTDLESISRWHNSIRNYGGDRIGGAGHWMIDLLLKIHSFKREWQLFSGSFPSFGKTPAQSLGENLLKAGVKLHKFSPPKSLEDKVALLVEKIVSGIEISWKDLAHVAPLLAIEELEQMLKSHELI